MSFISYKCSILQDPVNNIILSFLPYYVKQQKKCIEEEEIFLFKVKLSMCVGQILEKEKKKKKKLLPLFHDKLISLTFYAFFSIPPFYFVFVSHAIFLPNDSFQKRSEKRCYGDLLIGLLCTSCI